MRAFLNGCFTDYLRSTPSVYNHKKWKGVQVSTLWIEVWHKKFWIQKFHSLRFQFFRTVSLKFLTIFNLSGMNIKFKLENLNWIKIAKITKVRHGKLKGSLWFHSSGDLRQKTYFTSFKKIARVIRVISDIIIIPCNSLSANPTKWSNTLKQFVGC